MSDPTERPLALEQSGAILHALGRLSGEVHSMHQSNTKRFDDLKADIARLERSTGERITRVEQAFAQQLRDQGDRIGENVKSLGTRVTNLEGEDKRLIEKVARVSAVGGGISGGLITGVVELLKHLSR